MPSAIVYSVPSLSWPDGSPVFSGLSAAFCSGRVSLVGVSGFGESALLRLVSGRLTLRSDRVSAAADVGCLPQRLDILHVSATAAENAQAAAPGASPNEAETAACTQHALRPSTSRGGGSRAAAVS
jgi:ABC-type nitrate/sulfonate/bicarbonate transport system ATPase subunit